MLSTKFKKLSVGFSVSGIAFMAAAALYFSTNGATATTPALAHNANEFDVGTPIAKQVPPAPVIKEASLSLGKSPAPSTFMAEGESTPLNTDESIHLAKSMATEQNFDQALSILKNIRAEDQNEYAVEFLRARVLAWSGQHYLAEDKFISLSQDYPKDADIKVAYGYLKYYQKNFAHAEQLFTEVLINYPKYQDAKTGLKRVRTVQGQ